MKKPSSITLSDWRLLQRKYKDLEWVVKKIKQNYPVQYLIGNVDFYGLKILVNENVLIPRFETEGLVEKTISLINDLDLKKASVLEIGTGSGCISIALKSEMPSLEITALEISQKALKLAKRNAKYNKCKINFINKNMYKYNIVNKYEVLISNPPYIKLGEKIDPKTAYEPKIALYADDSGLEYYKQILKIATTSLAKKHLIALEIGEEQGEELKELIKKYFPQDIIEIAKDLPGKNRYIFVYSE